MTERNAIVELKDIRKEFPGVLALNQVNMAIRPGRVHALLGENGAGKSTLMKILSGEYTTYDGEIFLGGEKAEFKNEKDALDAGIAIVAQELHPVDEMSLAENLFLGRNPVKRFGFIDRKEQRTRTEHLLESIGLEYEPDTPMRELSIAKKQMMEILKAISRDCKVIVMDEPTSALTNREAANLFEKIEELKGRGIAIVFISHRLEEVFAVGDDFTVLRDGQFISSGRIDEVTQDDIISMMVGRDIGDFYPDIPPCGSDVVLDVRDFSSEGVFRDVSFRVRKGEILGLAGMMGAGRSEIARALFGFDPYDGGEIALNGRSLRIDSTKDAIKNGIAMVTEDRGAYGFVAVRSIKENIVLPNLDLFASKGFLKRDRIDGETRRISGTLGIKAPNGDTLVQTLSGGNQQKVVLAKWLVRNLDLLILDEPTRGIDVGAKQEIYRLMVELAEQGLAIILISSEMPEVISMSHRILVVDKGTVVGELERGEATQDGIMKMIIEGKTA